MDGFRAPVRERIYLAEQPRFWTKGHGAEWKGPETMKLGPGGTLSLGPKTTREDSDTTQEGPALDSKDMISDIRMGGPLNQIREPTYRTGGPTHWTRDVTPFSGQFKALVHTF